MYNSILIDNDILSKFKSIKLKEVKNIKLMSRIEHKFVCNREQLIFILNNICDYYYIQQHKHNYINKYHTVYYDTLNLLMYYAHCNKDIFRQKVRIREYENNKRYLEVKTKTDGISSKTRIKTNSLSIDKEQIKWLTSNLKYNPENLHKTLETFYNRITLVDNNKTERITIDFDIKFRNLLSNTEQYIDNIIIELKTNNEMSYITEIFKTLNIEKTSYSKYKHGIEIKDEL